MQLIKESLECPSCGVENDFDKYDKNEELYFYCAGCDYLIKSNIPNIKLIKEFFLFLINSSLLLSIPLLSLFFYGIDEAWDKYLPFIFLLSGSILSIAFHEFFHAITAFIFGDDAIFGKRYLRFDIRKYFHNFASFLLPVALFFITGVFLPGAAVYVDDNKINNRFNLAMVYIAGVVANLITLLIICYFLNNYDNIMSENTKILLHTIAFIQIIIIVFNLLPVPPLDGWGVISQILNQTIINIFQKLGFLILIVFISLAIYYDLFKYLYPIYEYLLDYFNLSSDYVFTGFNYLILYDPQTIKTFLSEILRDFNL